MYSYASFGKPFKFALFFTIPILCSNFCFILNVTWITYISLLISIVAKMMSFISFVVVFTFTSFLIPLVIQIISTPFCKTMVARTINFKKDCNSSFKLSYRDDMFGRIEALMFHKLQFSLTLGFPSFVGICPCLVAFNCFLVGKMHWYELCWDFKKLISFVFVPMVSKDVSSV